MMLNSTSFGWLAVPAYILLFFAVSAGALILHGKRRNQRPPERFKLRRGPRERQRRRADQISRDAKVAQVMLGVSKHRCIEL